MAALIETLTWQLATLPSAPQYWGGNRYVERIVHVRFDRAREAMTPYEVNRS